MKRERGAGGNVTDCRQDVAREFGAELLRHLHDQGRILRGYFSALLQNAWLARHIAEKEAKLSLAVRALWLDLPERAVVHKNSGLAGAVLFFARLNLLSIRKLTGISFRRHQ